MSDVMAANPQHYSMGGFSYGTLCNATASPVPPSQMGVCELFNHIPVFCKTVQQYFLSGRHLLHILRQTGYSKGYYSKGGHPQPLKFSFAHILFLYRVSTKCHRNLTRKSFFILRYTLDNCNIELFARSVSLHTPCRCKTGFLYL